MQPWESVASQVGVVRGTDGGKAAVSPANFFIADFASQGCDIARTTRNILPWARQTDAPLGRCDLHGFVALPLRRCWACGAAMPFEVWLPRRSFV